MNGYQFGRDSIKLSFKILSRRLRVLSFERLSKTIRVVSFERLLRMIRVGSCAADKKAEKII